MACEYKISVIKIDYQSESCSTFVAIKPNLPSFDSLKEAIYDRFPVLNNQPLYIFYRDFCGDNLIIQTVSDFEIFKQQNISKIFLKENRQPEEWYNMSSDTDDMLACEYKVCRMIKRIDETLIPASTYNLFVLIKPKSPTFESFEEAVRERFPTFKTQRMLVFYIDSLNRWYSIQNQSDFRAFQEERVKCFYVAEDPLSLHISQKKTSDETDDIDEKANITEEPNNSNNKENDECIENIVKSSQEKCDKNNEKNTEADNHRDDDDDDDESEWADCAQPIRSPSHEWTFVETNEITECTASDGTGNTRSSEVNTPSTSRKENASSVKMQTEGIPNAIVVADIQASLPTQVSNAF